MSPPVYKLLLTLRYLRRKLTPLFALMAVALCTAMVMIVLSIMGGFLNLVETTGKSMIGDVTVSAGLSGVPHYEKLIERIEAEEAIAAATPQIKALGLLKIPYHNGSQGVQVVGIDPRTIGEVIEFEDNLFWTPQRATEHEHVGRLFQHHNPLDLAKKMKIEGQSDPVTVMGIEINPANHRDNKGRYSFPVPVVGAQVSVTLVPVTEGGGILDPVAEKFIVVNEFHSGLYDVDANFIYVRLDLLQKLLKLEETDRIKVDEKGEPVFGPEGQPVIEGKNPARVTTIEVRAADGATDEQALEAVRDAYRQMVSEHPELAGYRLNIQTWRQRQSKLLSAVANEKGLMAFLFGIISLVAVVMVGVIFYMIVLEKTRDIGILRAIGASQPGVASIFLAYGGVIGTLGAGLGTLLAYGVVTNINEIHEWFGDGFGSLAYFLIPALGVALLYVIFGFGHVAIELMFSKGRSQILFGQMILGAGLGLVVAPAFIWAAVTGEGKGWTERFYSDSGQLKIAMLVFGVLALEVGMVLLALTVGLQYWIPEKLASWSRRARVLLFGAAGMGVGLAVMSVVHMTGDRSIDELNRDLGFQIWDRSVYFFDQIPSKMDGFEVTVIAVVAIASSVIGSIIPAVRAAMVDPVESLRYE